MAPLPCCVTEVDGPAALLVKGALQTSEPMEELVAPTAGLRTERRMSHGFVMQVDRHPRVLLISDAALNVQPDAVAGRLRSLALGVLAAHWQQGATAQLGLDS